MVEKITEDCRGNCSIKTRCKIEAKYRILKLYCEMKQQYNPHDSITDINVRETEKKFIIGFIEALKLALKEIEELK